MAASGHLERRHPNRLISSTTSTLNSSLLQTQIARGETPLSSYIVDQWLQLLQTIPSSSFARRFLLSLEKLDALE